MTADEIAALDLEPYQPIELETATLGCAYKVFRGIRRGCLYYASLGGDRVHGATFAHILSVTPLHYN